jgi:hypothetical protein
MDAARLASAIPLAALARVRRPDDPINVLLVHNDGSYRRRLANELSKRGFAVQSFADSSVLLTALGAGLDADIIVALARGASKMLGAEFLAELDRRGVDLAGHLPAAPPSADRDLLRSHLEAIDLAAYQIPERTGRPICTTSPDHRDPALAGPVAYLGGQEFAPLLRSRPVGPTPMRIARPWWDRIPLESGLAIAVWMLNKGIVVSHALGPRKDKQ